MQVEHKTENGTVLFLKIESDYSIAGLNDGHIYFWTSSLLQSMGDYPLCVEIPNGNFEYIGLTIEVTEDQAHMMLGENKSILTSIMLFKSLMQHLSLEDGNYVVLFKPNEK